MATRFNSIVVRLKEDAKKLYKLGLESFNSIVVRLKESDPDTIECRIIKFQFHSGSIKSTGWCSSNPALPRFNSIVVRLKGQKAGSAENLSRRFNSIVVRLKGEENWWRLSRTTKFQFHSGSIKREHPQDSYHV